MQKMFYLVISNQQDVFLAKPHFITITPSCDILQAIFMAWFATQ